MHCLFALDKMRGKHIKNTHTRTHTQNDRRINACGAQQLQIDTQVLRTKLLKLPNIGFDPSDAKETENLAFRRNVVEIRTVKQFENHVKKNMDKVNALLKTMMLITDNNETIATNFRDVTQSQGNEQGFV